MPSLAVTTSVRLPSAAAIVAVAPKDTGICTLPQVPPWKVDDQWAATPLSAAELQLLTPVVALKASTSADVPTITSPFAITGDCSPGFVTGVDHTTCKSDCASATSVVEFSMRYTRAPSVLMRLYGRLAW